MYCSFIITLPATEPLTVTHPAPVTVVAPAQIWSTIIVVPIPKATTAFVGIVTTLELALVISTTFERSVKARVYVVPTCVLIAITSSEGQV